MNLFLSGLDILSMIRMKTSSFLILIDDLTILSFLEILS